MGIKPVKSQLITRPSLSGDTALPPSGLRCHSDVVQPSRDQAAHGVGCDTSVQAHIPNQAAMVGHQQVESLYPPWAWLPGNAQAFGGPRELQAGDGRGG